MRLNAAIDSLLLCETVPVYLVSKTAVRFVDSLNWEGSQSAKSPGASVGLGFLVFFWPFESFLNTCAVIQHPSLVESCTEAQKQMIADSQRSENIISFCISGSSDKQFMLH